MNTRQIISRAACRHAFHLSADISSCTDVINFCAITF